MLYLPNLSNKIKAFTSRSCDEKNKFLRSNINKVEERNAFARIKKKLDESNSKKDNVYFHYNKNGQFNRD